MICAICYTPLCPTKAVYVQGVGWRCKKHDKKTEEASTDKEKPESDAP